MVQTFGYLSTHQTDPRRLFNVSAMSDSVSLLSVLSSMRAKLIADQAPPPPLTSAIRCLQRIQERFKDGSLELKHEPDHRPLIKHKSVIKPVVYKEMLYTTQKSCCKRQCWRPGVFSETQVATWRKSLDSCGYTNTRQRAQGAKNLWPSLLMHDGKPCCASFLCWLFAINKASLYFKPVAVPQRRDNSIKDISILAWFQNLKLVIDKMPDEPVWQVAAPWKKTVWEWYQGDVSEYEQYVSVSCDYFMKKWPADVKLRKWMRFSKCGVCESNRKIKWDRTTSHDEKALATETLVAHYKQVKRERAYALSKAQQAVERPKEFLSIALDGTDQLPKGIPQFNVDTSTEARYVDRLKVKFTIATIHGLETSCYDHLDNVAGDPNLTIEVRSFSFVYDNTSVTCLLFLVMQVLQRTLKRAEHLLGRLPDTLYLQMDNCWRENKNSALANWCALLCERGLFKGGVFLSFLPKGHTHNECDQIASRLSVAVRRKTILTRAELYVMMKKCFKNVRCEAIDFVADSKKFLNPQENDRWTGSKFQYIHQISKFRFFRIKLTAANNLEIRTKKSCEDDYWSLHHLMRRVHGTKSGLTYDDLSTHPGYTYKKLDEEILEKTRESLKKCSHRLSENQYTQLMGECQQLFNPQPPAQLDPKVMLSSRFCSLCTHNLSMFRFGSSSTRKMMRNRSFTKKKLFAKFSSNACQESFITLLR